jgi:hypothetical protein
MKKDVQVKRRLLRKRFKRILPSLPQLLESGGDHLTLFRLRELIDSL